VSDAIETLSEILKQDAENPFPRYPPVASHLLADDRVRESLRRREDENQGLMNVSSLGYSFYTGLQFTCFEFTRVGPLDRLAAFLVISDEDCRVVGLVDPFDPAMPNSKIPPLPSRGEQPFALARPTGVPNLDARALYPLEVRSRDFFERLQLAQSAARGTKCTYETDRTRICVEWTEGDLGEEFCDDFEEQVTTDTVTDDC
jgi:hypothetical protein